MINVERLNKDLEKYLPDYRVEVENLTKNDNATWHDKVRFKFFNKKVNTVNSTLYPIYNVTISPNMTGCGTAVMSTFTNKIPEAITFILLSINEYTRTNRVGSIICTLGHIFHSTWEKDLLNIGFKEIMSYPNLHHNSSGNVIQKMYGLLLPLNQDSDNSFIFDMEKLTIKRKEVTSVIADDLPF